MLREPACSVASLRAAPRGATRVLIADDDGDMLDLVTRSLRRQGFEVEAVRDGRELLERLAIYGPDGAPDLLITDVQMPAHSGVDVVGLMRARGWTKPVILVTAYPHQALVEQVDELGDATVLPKPFELHRLVSLVRNALQRP
jgi:DNA-binding response OmpR family regulator